MGPLLIFSNSHFKISDEDLLMLLSTTDNYYNFGDSSILGPTYNQDQVIMIYTRTVNNPEAKDERLALMGTDIWILIYCKKDLELILQSKIELAKEILDIEFDSINDLSQIDVPLAEKVISVIEKLY